MGLREDFALHVNAGFSGLWIRSVEPEDAVNELLHVCRENAWQLVEYDIASGLNGYQEPVKEALAEVRVEAAKPSMLLSQWPQLVRKIQNRELAAAAAGKDVPPQRTILVMHNMHRKELLVDNSLLIQSLYNLTRLGRTAEGQFVIVLVSHTTRIPEELSKVFTILEHPLPDAEMLTKVASRILPEGHQLPEGEPLRRLLDAAAGMTGTEAENAFALSFLRNKPYDPLLIWDLKAQSLKKSGLLTVYQGNATFDRLGGMHQFRDFTSRLLEHVSSSPRLKPRGVICVGVQGSGKSQAIKALGHTTGRKVLQLDVGSLMGGLVGQTEASTRQAIELAEAMEPCILMLDEVEKALAGAGGGGNSDSGVVKRMFGTLLTWLNDKTKDVFVCATSNNIELLPAEFYRAGRFDAMFFFDLPDDNERRAIWMIYLQEFGFDHAEATLDKLVQESVGWTGSEIEQACRVAAIARKPLSWAQRMIVPLSRSAESQITALQTWAKGRCLSANRPGLYGAAVKNAKSTSGARVVHLPPSPPFHN